MAGREPTAKYNSAESAWPYNHSEALVRSIVPILLQPRDRFIDEEGVWVVINRLEHPRRQADSRDRSEARRDEHDASTSLP